MGKEEKDLADLNVHDLWRLNVQPRKQSAISFDMEESSNEFKYLMSEMP